jgi:hypothetical protein
METGRVLKIEERVGLAVTAAFMAAHFIRLALGGIFSHLLL